MSYDLTKYHEEKPHRMKRIIWALVNATLFRLACRYGRVGMLRLFGAKIGRKCLIYRSVKVFAPWNLEMGDAVCIGPRVELYSKDKIVLGSQITISQDVYICTAGHDIKSEVFALKTAPVKIGDRCWVAARAAVLPGVTLGEGCVVGACAVAAKSFPKNSVIVGNPGQVIKQRDEAK